jgi:hypothetical protein
MLFSTINLLKSIQMSEEISRILQLNYSMIYQNLIIRKKYLRLKFLNNYKFKL